MAFNIPAKKQVYSFILCLLFFGSCTETEKQPTGAQLTTIEDTPFWQEYHEAYPVSSDPVANEVRSIALDVQGNAWIATPTGVFTKKAGEKFFLNAIPEDEQGPSFSVVVDRHDAVWMSTWSGIYRSSENKLERMPGADTPISTLAVSDEGVYALGPDGVWLYSATGCSKKSYHVARSVRDAISDNKGGLWIASDVGLYHAKATATKHLVKAEELISAYIRGVALKEDELWAGGLGGVTVVREEKSSKFLRPADGIPSVNVTCIKLSPEGIMWVGTDAGVVRYKSDGSRSLLFSRRWLLDDKVNDIDFDQQGNAWIATAKGVSVIRRKKMDLESKERYFYDVLMRRHIREPWIAGQCRLPLAGDTTKWEPEDDDNDGEYTGNYLAMESFRYATTKREDAKAKAKKAFEFLKLLQEVTDTDGFFARTIVPSSWTSVHDNNREYNARELADERVKEPRFKPVTVRWHKSSDGKWLWKGDTSSDEICGHMFGYFIYYELVADDREKDVVRNHVSKIVDHLIQHNFTLTDKDDKPTRWGVWSPDKLNHDPEWAPDRSLNSMELLSFIKLAYYMTDDEKYQLHYLRLINDEGYLDNMNNIPNQNPAWFIYFDVILAAYQYPILLKCEKDPALRAVYEQHMDAWLEQRKGDKNPLINFIYCYARGKKVELQSSVDLLVDTPLDLIDWPIDHSRREDIRIVHRPVLDEFQVNELQPASIRATIRWDKNPWSVGGGNPHVEREPVFWLLPYWMGRYLEMIN